MVMCVGQGIRGNDISCWAGQWRRLIAVTRIHGPKISDGDVAVAISGCFWSRAWCPGADG